MDTKTGAPTFEPKSELVKEGECDTLLIYLSGFKKEQLRVQLAKSGLLIVSGGRSTGENKWISFRKEFPVAANCEATKITAKFDQGILYIHQPKLIVDPADGKKAPPAQKPDEKQAPPQNTSSPEPAAEKKETEPANDEPKRISKEDEKTDDGPVGEQAPSVNKPAENNNKEPERAKDEPEEINKTKEGEKMNDGPKKPVEEQAPSQEPADQSERQETNKGTTKEDEKTNDGQVLGQNESYNCIKMIKAKAGEHCKAYMSRRTVAAAAAAAAAAVLVAFGLGIYTKNILAVFFRKGGD